MATNPSRKTPCIDCAVPSYGERCRPCVNQARVCVPRRIRSVDDPRVVRRLREQAAPGLSAHARSALLAQWKRQGRECAYCPDLATTVDHVVPLVRGGTNHEGNLAPACRSCNGSKGGLTLIEWRTGKRLPPMITVPEWMTPRPRRIKVLRWAEPQALTLCACGTLTTRPKWCGEYSCYRDSQRNAYRAAAGIPADAPITAGRPRERAA